MSHTMYCYLLRPPFDFRSVYVTLSGLLLQVVRDGREELVKKLIDSLSAKKKSKIINSRDSFGFTALHYAARFNRFTIMHLLYNEKAG